LRYAAKRRREGLQPAARSRLMSVYRAAFKQLEYRFDQRRRETHHEDRSHNYDNQDDRANVRIEQRLDNFPHPALHHLSPPPPAEPLARWRQRADQERGIEDPDQRAEPVAGPIEQ